MCIALNSEKNIKNFHKLTIGKKNEGERVTIMYMFYKLWEDIRKISFMYGQDKVHIRYDTTLLKVVHKLNFHKPIFIYYNVYKYTVVKNKSCRNI